MAPEATTRRPLRFPTWPACKVPSALPRPGAGSGRRYSPRSCTNFANHTLYKYPDPPASGPTAVRCRRPFVAREDLCGDSLLSTRFEVYTAANSCDCRTRLDILLDCSFLQLHGWIVLHAGHGQVYASSNVPPMRPDGRPAHWDRATADWSCKQAIQKTSTGWDYMNAKPVIYYRVGCFCESKLMLGCPMKSSAPREIARLSDRGRIAPF